MGQSNEEQILRKLDQILRVITMGLTRGLRQREQIVLLDRVGFQPKETAELLGTTANTVSKELSLLRKATTRPVAVQRRKRKRN